MMITKRFDAALVAATVALLPALAFAQEHGGGEAHGGGEHAAGLPTVVYLQAINFVIYAGLLVYFLRTPVREYFSGRGAAFNAALTKAATAKAEAEARKQDVQNKIRDLEKNAASDLAQAKTDAAALEARILKEAEELSVNLRTEANRTASFEIERAKNELREELLQQSLAFSQRLLKDKIAEGDQKRLQGEFVDKVHQVGANR